jgi:hypothetical protein
VRRRHRGGGARHWRGGACRGCGRGRAVEGGGGGGHMMEGGRRGGASTSGCGEMAGLGFGGSGALKKKNNSSGR